jgi:polyvinyl alcohol dehydrogenase (cytochrome)
MAEPGKDPGAIGHRRRHYLDMAAARIRLVATLVAGASLYASAVFGAGAAGAASVWGTYHANSSRTGADASEPSLDPLRAAWSNALDGSAEFGQPVVAAGRVFVATEDDNVFALDAHNGRVLWRASIGEPLRNVNNYVCGDIDPLGITSTPVVDVSRSTVYVAGELSTAGAPPVAFRLVGFNIYSGSVVVTANSAPVLPAGESLLYLQQRAALALANGRVYVSYGGHDGDCGNYHGWVVGVDESGIRPNVQFDTTPQSSGGAIWEGGGGPSVDASGNLYVVTGNPNSGGPDPWGEAVVKLNPDLTPLAAFQDPVAVDDDDLGTGDAVLLPSSEVFAVGKTDIGYLLRQADLRQVHAISGTVCSSDPDGGPAYDAADDSVFVPCRGGGIQQVNLRSFATGWQSGSVNSAPILVDGELWALEYNSGVLQELSPSTGNPIQTISTGRSVPNFASPTSADGLLLIGTDSGVAAYDGPSGPPPPAPPPPAPTAGYWLAAADGGVFSFGTAGYHGSLGHVHLTAPIVGMAPTPDGKGYWLVARDGGVFTFGDAHFYGSAAGFRLAQPVVGMAVAPGGKGYWLVARDGGVFTFGPGARFHGSTGNVRLRQPIVGMSTDPVTGGYWLVAADGGVFSFDAPFYGSTGSVHLDQPVVGMASGRAGNGYWLVARDGGIFTFGPGAKFYGSAGGANLLRPIVGLSADLASGGYWLVAADGQVFNFHAPFEGSAGGLGLAQPVVGMAVP